VNCSERRAAMARVQADRRRGETEARCEERCLLPFYSPHHIGPASLMLPRVWSPREVRDAARQHAAETGHVVEVTVEDVTRYEPGEDGSDA
jgi:hypothetical protein